METCSIPDDLPAVWRKRADWLREFGDPNTARLWDTAARELEEALRAEGEQSYTLTQAAKLSGFTPDHLSALVKKGRIPNAGRDGAPRIRRSDLPMKRDDGPGRTGAVVALPTYRGAPECAVPLRRPIRDR